MSGLARNPALRAARRLVVTVVGATVLAVGVALLVLPGPAFVVIPAGLAILATEFVWARRLLERARDRIRAAVHSPAAPKPTEDRTSGPVPIGVLVLAGARGGEDRFVRASGAAHRALIPVAGAPLLVHVLRALRDAPEIGPVWISTDAAGETAAKPVLAAHGLEPPAAWLRSAASPARSLLAALESGAAPPLLVTTADHALLDGAILRSFLDGARRGEAAGADLVAGVVPAALVRERYPGQARTLLRFRDQTLCGANLFLLSNRAAKSAVSFWIQVEADRKRPLRLLRHFGWGAALRFALGRLVFADALEIAAHRLGCRVAAVPIRIAEAAIDVDNEADRRLADQVLRSRQAAASSRSASATTRSSPG